MCADHRPLRRHSIAGYAVAEPVRDARTPIERDFQEHDSGAFGRDLQRFRTPIAATEHGRKLFRSQG